MVSISEYQISKKYFGAREVKNLVDEISNYQSLVYIRPSGSDKQINAKSIVGVLGLGIKPTYRFQILCWHTDIKQCQADLEKVLKIIDEL